VAYAKALHGLVVWLGICDGNLQEGSFRCDANVSVRPAGSTKLGTRVEIKNLNSFRFLHQAIDHEVRRQVELIEDGGRVVQETRLYDPNRDETRAMRSKEDAMDYRYFPDPDLLPLQIEPAWIAAVQATMPELPAAMRARIVRTHGLSDYDAAVLTGSRGIATYYEAVADAVPDRKAAANWVMGEVAAALNESQIDIERAPVSAAQLAQLIAREADGTINHKTAKDVWAGEGASADAIIDARGLRQINDAGAIERLIDGVLAANPGPVAEFRAGKEKAFNSLVGQAMKATKGKANPQQVNDILRRRLAAG
jgi:aspartyl-tRNA(Asn)/glutamyl-tRNA(Gln) amidotransferase subunit B